MSFNWYYSTLLYLNKYIVKMKIKVMLVGATLITSVFTVMDII